MCFRKNVIKLSNMRFNITFNCSGHSVKKMGKLGKVSRGGYCLVVKGFYRVQRPKKGMDRSIPGNCCGCCCDILLAYKQLGSTSLINPTNYIASIEKNVCSGCGICADKCPVNAISIKDDKAIVNKKVCLGCDVCTRFCPVHVCKMAASYRK